MSLEDKKQKIDLMLRKKTDPREILRWAASEIQAAPDTQTVRELQVALAVFEESFPNKKEFYETLAASDKRLAELLKKEYEQYRSQKPSEKVEEFKEELA